MPHPASQLPPCADPYWTLAEAPSPLGFPEFVGLCSEQSLYATFYGYLALHALSTSHSATMTE